MKNDSLRFFSSVSILDIFKKVSSICPNIVKHCENNTYIVEEDFEIFANARNGAFFNSILDFTEYFEEHKVIFKGNVVLKCHFTQDIYFKNCEFCKDFIANNLSFQGNIYFNKGCVDFHESKFNQTACFYGVTFKEVPNFSQTIFNSNLNLVNSNLNFNFDKCDNVVDVERKRREDKIIKYYNKDKVANDFRDSFRGFKSALIKDSNLLDASNYHRVELYFKEIELKCKTTKSAKEYVDLLQLWLYGKTSDHHTDLLKIISWSVILAGIFATILFFVGYLYYLKIFWSVTCAIYSILFIMAVVYDKTISFIILVLLNFIPCVYLMTYNPKYIFGVANLFTNDNTNNLFFNLIISIYTILFILLIFSLQKTARRNSIIPN